MTHTVKAIVLIVEDEPLIRLAAVDIVEGAGFSVLEAQDADEALALLDTHTEIAIVFTDIEMPGSIDGMALAARIRDRWPPVEIILTSGRVPERDVKLPSRGVFLAKPYRPAELTGQLSRMAA